MTTTVTIIIVLAALLLGHSIGFLSGTLRGRQTADARVAQAKTQARQDAREHYDAMLEGIERHNRETADQMNARFQETVALMKQEVQNSTRQLLRDRQAEFAALSQEKLAGIMEPLQRDILSMQEAVKENTARNAGFNGQLQQGIKSVLEQSMRARESADKLVSALTLSNKSQGQWGERILTELLESTGMKQGIHFDVQEFIRDEGGRKVLGDGGNALQPDVILHIEPGHDVVVDSKVSLTAFFSYNEAQTQAERERFLTEHVNSLKSHVKELVRKDYSGHLKGALDYVIMFVPVTQALYVATQREPSLWREAMEKRVYIADEQTLYAALKIIDLNWRQQAQAENHAEIFRLAGEMMDRMRLFLGHMQKAGNALGTAQKCFDDAYAKLWDGQQSVAKTCRKLTDLGAKYDRTNQAMANLIDKGEED